MQFSNQVKYLGGSPDASLNDNDDIRRPFKSLHTVQQTSSEAPLLSAHLQ